MTTTGYIKYSGGYKYILNEDTEIQTEFRPEKDIATPYCTLSTTGLLHIFKGYAWDGPSGPTYDRNTNMRGSLFHDVLYQLIRQMFLPFRDRCKADELLIQTWKDDGMWGWLANIEGSMIAKFGDDSARPSAEHEVKLAP